MVSVWVTTRPSSSSVSGLLSFRVESMCSWLFLLGRIICLVALAGVERACHSFCPSDGSFLGICCCLSSQTGSKTSWYYLKVDAGVLGPPLGPSQNCSKLLCLFHGQHPGSVQGREVPDPSSHHGDSRVTTHFRKSQLAVGSC